MGSGKSYLARNLTRLYALEQKKERECRFWFPTAAVALFLENGTLELYLDGKTTVPGAEVSDTRRPRLRLADRVTNLIDTLTDSNDLAVMRQYETAVCRIPVGGYGTTEFRMSAERQKLLIDSGTAAMQTYLKTLMH